MINLGGVYEQALAFPPHDVSPETKKTKEYALQFSRAFYSAWLRNETIWTYADRVKFDGLRRLAVGKQPDDIYYQMCYGKDEHGNIIRKGYMNVNWEILKVAVKYRNAFIGMFTDIDYEIQATSINPFATRKKDEKKWRTWVQTKIMPQIQIDVAKVSGEPEIEEMEIDKPQMEPEDLTELEVMSSLGMFRLEEELAFEQFIKATFDVISKFPENIKDKILEDLWDIGRCVIKDYVDPVTQKVSVRYADAANCVLRRRTDGSLLDGGEFMLMSIADLRAESGYTEDELMKVAFNYCDRFGNMGRETFERNKGQMNFNKTVYSQFFYDDIKVLVLDSEYATVDKKYTTEVKSEKGTKYFPEQYGRKRNSEKRKTHVTSVPTYYRAKWIVGTDMVYDHGMQYDIPRPDKTRANCSYHYVELTTPSPTEVASPVYHQVQLAWLKLQNASAKAKPDGYAYDEAQLINSVLGGKTTPDQAIRMSEQTGRLFYKTINARGGAAMAANAGPPVIPMPGGMGTALNDFVVTYNLMVEMLQELTGLSRQATASPMPAKTGKGVSEIALGATNNVMKPIINLYRKIKQDTAQNVLLRGQIVFRHNKEIARDYYDILGEATVKMLQNASKEASQIGISLIPRINDEMRAKIEQAALEAMAVDRNGGAGITAKDFVLIQSLLDQGANPKLIQGALAMYEQRRAKMKEESARAAAKEQTDGLAMLEKAKNENKTKEMILKAFLDVEVKKAESELETNKAINTNFVNQMVNGAFAITMGDPAAMQQGMGQGMQQQLPSPASPEMPMEEPMMPQPNI